MIAATLLALSAAVSPPSLPPTKAFGIIVANNRGFDSTLAPLSYADDDGARYHELFSLMTERVDVLAVLDQESQKLHPATAAAARSPSRRELLKSLDEIFAAIEAANSQGQRTVFYFIYVGHGSVGEDGEGSLHLVDSRFTRSDLFQSVIARSPAAVNHLVIDACNAYLLIAKRGDSAADIDAAVDGFLSEESLDRYPNTGVLLSTSKAADVHEWSQFQAGIFSHEVRSALVGGADVDGNGIVTYSETRAFLGAANGRVTDPRARLEPHVKAPKLHAAEPLFDRTLAKAGHFVRVPKKIAGRYYLEDTRGVRFADVNMGKDADLSILLLPGLGYYLRGQGKQRKIPEGAVAQVDASQLRAERDTLASRGAEEESFRKYLFAIPFSRSYFDGFSSMAEQAPSVRLVRAPGKIEPGQFAAIGMGVASAGALAAGIGFGLSANRAADDYRSYIGTQTERERLRSSADGKATTSTIFYAAGASLAVGAIVTWLLTD